MVGLLGPHFSFRNPLPSPLSLGSTHDAAILGTYQASKLIVVDSLLS